MRTLVGKLGELGPGTHTVRVTDIDLSTWNENYIAITFADSTSTTHHQRIYTTVKGTDDPSPQFTELLKALLPDDDALEEMSKQYEHKDIKEAVLTALRNCSLILHLRQGSGFTVVAGDRGYLIQDVDSGNYFYDDNDKLSVYNSIREARNAAKQLGLRPSYTNAVRYEALNESDNINILYSSLEGITAAASALGDTRRLFNPSALRPSTAD